MGKEAEKQINLDLLIQDLDKDNLEPIAFTQRQLDLVKDSLNAIIDSVAKDPSMLSRAAKIWGELPLWEKASVGAVLTIPTLTIGIVGHLGTLLVLSGATALVYTTGGFILDDHYHSTTDMVGKLKKGVVGMADVLAFTIGALDKIRLKLSEELNKLTDNVNKLDGEVSSLREQVERFAETEKKLSTTKDELEATIIKIKEESADNQQRLTEKIAGLSNVKTSLELEVEKARQVASVLQSTVQSLSGAVIADQNDRQFFQEKLATFLSDKSASFDKVADRICAAETELKEVKNELQQTNARYQALLQQQENQVARLERLCDQTPPKSSLNPYRFTFASPLIKNLNLSLEENSVQQSHTPPYIP